jgi:uncharacterized membrane protein
MSDRQVILAWSERGAIRDVRSALSIAGVLPGARDWRAFLDHLLLWSGAIALAAAVVFFIAHNWSSLGRFAKFGLIEILMVVAVAGYWRLGTERAAGKASLLAAAILLGGLLALFGQTYQTGADTWELFANWAALMAPWVLIARFAAMWMLWLAIVNAAIVLYFLLFPGLFGLVFSTERQLWSLFAFNTAALVSWELAARRWKWLNERWAPRLLAIASGTLATLLVLQSIFAWREASAAAPIAYPLWLAGVYVAYRMWFKDVFVLAGACLSLIVVVAAWLGRMLLEHHADAGGFFVISLIVIGMAAASGWWLKRIAAEVTA